MGTSAPIRKVYDIPVEKPAPAKENPLSLPSPEPDRWFTPVPREPAKIPARKR